MKAVIALSCLIVVVSARAAADTNKYTTKYDGINLDEILKSDRLFNNYYKCLMDQGRCTPDGAELKKILPDALKTDCKKCNDKQRAGTERVLRFVIDNKKDQWEKLQAKYDPTGIYIEKFRKEAAARQINI